MFSFKNLLSLDSLDTQTSEASGMEWNAFLVDAFSKWIETFVKVRCYLRDKLTSTGKLCA